MGRTKKDELIPNTKPNIDSDPHNGQLDIPGNAPMPIAPPIKLAVQVLPETQKPIKIRRIETMEQTDLPEPVNGQYYVVPLDAKGNEITEKGFMIGKRTYEKVYAKLPDEFRVKKNPNI